jgi:cysteine desulfurase
MSKPNSHKEIYFDNNATTKPLPEVREEVCKVLGEEFGNPSSIHSTGERARKYLANARQHLADLLGFTSSGTEANNLVLYSCTLGAREKSRIVISNVEHSSINKMCSFLEIHGVEIEYLRVDSSGFLNLEDLEKALKKETDLVSIQWVNNETGVIQDIESITEWI